LAELARQVCDRKFGVGADGLILAERGSSAPFAMRMFNPDGSESEMCGNGVRCFALFLRDNGLTEAATIPVETGAGLLTLDVAEDGRVRVDMGPARLTRGEIGMTGPAGERFVAQPVAGTDRVGTAVSMGNPHLVVFVPDVEAVDLEREGRALEHHGLFPNRVNVHFVQVVSRTHLRQRTWERGAGATLACGTGACAVAVAGFLNGLSERAVTVSLPGGDLSVEYCEDGRVLMTGPAETVFVGEWPSGRV
jgi:diaminopimelate epimerase